MLNLKSQEIINDSLVYVLTNCQESLAKLKKNFDATNVKFKQLDITSIPAVEKSNRHILLLDPKLEEKVENKTFREQINQNFHLFTFSDSSGQTAFDQYTQGHLNLPFSTQDISNMINHCSVQNSFQKEIDKMDKLAGIGVYAGSIVHDLNNYNTLCMTSLDAIKNINSRNYKDPKIDLLAGKGLKGTMALKRLAARYRRLIKEDKTEFETFSLRKSLNEALFTLADQLKAHGITLSMDESIAKEISIEGDEFVFIQVCINLIKNSIEAVSNKKEKWIKLSFSKIKGSFYLCVVDSGSGLKEEEENKIFNKGFSTKQDGHGFGLAFSDIELQKMDFELVYIKAKNTTFGIKIPKDKFVL